MFLPRLYMFESTLSGRVQRCGQGYVRIVHLIARVPPWPHATEEYSAAGKQEDDSNDYHANNKGSFTIERCCFSGEDDRGGGHCGRL